jgi:uncharacterized protein YsxB (DUF464 family)
MRTEGDEEQNAQREKRAGDTGRDETSGTAVCAAVSGILYALAGWLLNQLSDEGRPGFSVQEFQLDSGDAALSWSGGAEAGAAFELTVIGLEQIAAKYPDRLEIFFQR